MCVQCTPCTTTHAAALGAWPTGTPLLELDISRSAVSGAAGDAAAARELGALAAVVTMGGELRVLGLAHTAMGDAAGASFVTELGLPRLEPGKAPSHAHSSTDCMLSGCS